MESSTASGCVARHRAPASDPAKKCTCWQNAPRTSPHADAASGTTMDTKASLGSRYAISSGVAVRRTQAPLTGQRDASTLSEHDRIHQRIERTPGVQIVPIDPELMARGNQGEASRDDVAPLVVSRSSCLSLVL